VAGTAPAGPLATLTVAADGSAQYRSVQAAINAAPANSSARTTISTTARATNGMFNSAGMFVDGRDCAATNVIRPHAGIGV
jgi:pectin methylesterase-like acyl-CoA thioesterase